MNEGMLQKFRKWLHTNEVSNFRFLRWKLYYAHAGWRIIISRSASNAIQFAIDHAVDNTFYLKGTFDIKSSIIMRDAQKLEGNSE